MKFRKHISKLLALGILTNNIYFSSSANTEIPNRYQTLEGEYITIDDSTEGELVEIEVFGNTVQDENNLEDIQSVGDLYVDESGNPILDSQGREQYKIDIVSTSKNLYDIKLRPGAYQVTTGIYGDDFANYICSENDKIPVLSNTEYSLNISSNVAANISDVFFLNENNEIISKPNNSLNFITTDNTKYIKFNILGSGISVHDINLVQLEMGQFTGFYPSIRNEASILLPTQLQKVGDVADRLYWDNEKGRYIVEKNIDNFTSDWLLSENKFTTMYHPNYYESYAEEGANICIRYTNVDMFRSIDIIPVYNTTIGHISETADAFGAKEGSFTRYSGQFVLFLNCDKIKEFGIDFSSAHSVGDVISAMKSWLEKNPTIFYYVNSNPQLIETNITSKLIIPAYEGKTHVYVDLENGINPTLKVTVDRLPQIAKNAVEDAEINSTSSNISLARMYINMLPESLYKDQLQEQLSEVFSSDMTLDRNNATANLDIYIKSENMLSMSLDTNSVSFDNYSGVSAMEIKDAVGITISSSLPYSLNAYMPNNITSSDGLKTMPIDILNIKEGSKNDYQTFTDTTNKVVLKGDCTKGNGTNHSIDLKLDSNDAHIADVYKTVIKFEAEQR